MVLTRDPETATNGHRTGGAGAARRAIGRRPALPNGRAVLGGLLVAAAAVGTYAAWSSADDSPSTRYAAAVRDIGVGEVIEAEDVELVAFDAPESVAGAAFGSSQVGLLVGQITVAPIAAGDLLQRSAVVVPEDARPARQLSFPIDVADALAGTIERGERVDVLVTFGGTGQEITTEIVVSDAVVADVIGEGDDAGGQVVLLLSLPDDADLLALATAVRRGDLTIVRTTGLG